MSLASLKATFFFCVAVVSVENLMFVLLETKVRQQDNYSLYTVVDLFIAYVHLIEIIKLHWVFKKIHFQKKQK